MRRTPVIVNGALLTLAIALASWALFIALHDLLPVHLSAEVHPLVPAALAAALVAVYLSNRRREKALARQLDELEASLRTYAAASEDIVFRYRLHPETRIEFVNQAVAGKLGYGPEAFFADPGFGLSITHPEDAAKAKGGAPPDGVVRFRDARGRYLWFSVKSVPFLEGGRVAGFTAVCRDITATKDYEAELREAKERAETANRLKNSLLANMSHEIRTPMTAVLGYAELLSLKLQGTPEEQSIETIRQSGRRLLTLLDGMIDLARIESDRLDLRPTVHRAADTIERVREMMRVLVEKKGLAFVGERPADALYVNSDPYREEQVLINLVNNALRFTEHGEIRLSARGEARGGRPYVCFEVADTGVGIADDFLPYVYEEFAKGESRAAGATSGSGLGLAIVKKLVDKMGGAIEIGPGAPCGTVVSVWLPAAPADERVAAPPVLPPDVRPQSSPDVPAGRSVLVIEDDGPAGMLLSDALGVLFHVEVFATGEAGVARARERAFDVVVLDINLKAGGPNGIETLRRIRALPGYEALPALALTAFAMKGDREQFLAAGFDDYLAKPFDIFVLRRRVYDLCAKTAGTRAPA